MCRKNFGQDDHRAPITEEVGEFGETFDSGLPDAKKSETFLLPIADAFRRFRGKHCRF